MPKISACIISYNEEKKIEDCLRSMQGVVDEIVVVDSMSTDKTIEIAKKYTDKIYSQEFLGYVKQKNLAIGKAEFNWILSLDCDERLSPALRDSILEKKQRLDEFDAFKMARKTFYVYRWLNHIWYPDKKTRLFDKRKAKWVGVNLHEKIEISGNRLKLLDGDILHYSFDSISEHLQVIDKYTEIAAHEIIERGKKVSLLTPLVHAKWMFIRVYILKRGFLDGFAGFLVAVLSFVHVFVKYSKVIFYRRLNSKRSGCE